MDCSSCHSPNDSPRRFCRRCGRRLDFACPGCGFANAWEDAFCGGCGCAFVPAGEASAGAPASAAAGTPPPVPAAPVSEIEEILFGAPPVAGAADPAAQDAPLSQDAIDAIFRGAPPRPEAGSRGE